jgi:hypothetical protein
MDLGWTYCKSEKAFSRREQSELKSQKRRSRRTKGIIAKDAPKEKESWNEVKHWQRVRSNSGI